MKKIKDIDQIISDEPIYIYGAGSMGKYVFERIINERKDLKIKGFIDDSKKGTFCGLPVVNFKTFKADLNTYFIVIASSYHIEIEEKINNIVKNYIVADLLSFERDQKLTPIKYESSDLLFYTPNQFLYEVAKGIHTIEPNTNKWISTISEGVFYDIGASCGIYSILAAVNHNRVISIEPDALNFSILKKNFFLNSEKIDYEAVSVNMALGEIKEILDFNMLEYGEGFHGKFTSNSERNYNSNVYTERVLCSSLDSLVDDYQLAIPTHIKIDVDGAEMHVLRGMTKTLRNNDLKEILVEVVAEEKEKVLLFLEKFGFRFAAAHHINEITGFPVEGVENLLFKRL